MEDSAIKRNLRKLLRKHSRRMGDTWQVPRNDSRYSHLTGTKPRWDQTITSLDLIQFNGPDLFELQVNRLQNPEDDELVADFDYSFVFGQGVCTKSWSGVHPWYCFAGEKRTLHWPQVSARVSKVPYFLISA